MSFSDGWAAMNLEMPARVPRTEYSADIYHFELMRAVTGIDVHEHSSDQVKKRARFEFRKAWNYDLIWSTLIDSPELGRYATSMGHASYASDGSDLDREIIQPWKSPEDVLRFDPWATLGEKDESEIVRRFEEHYAANVADYPDAVNMTGVYITLVSGLIALFGWELLLTAAGMDPHGFGEVANRYSAWIQQYFNALARTNVPVVMVHDDIVWASGAIFAPDWYRTYVFPNLKRQLAPVLESGKKILFTSDGDYTAFADDIAACGVHGFALEPMTDLAYIAWKYGRTHVFIGNADTRILLSGTKDDIRREVERCMSTGKPCPGYFLSVGNHIPANTPVESALYYNECYEKMSRRT